MIKRVNIRTTTEIRNIQTPIYNSRQNIAMNTMDIRTCIMKGAYVDEILNDGSTLRLNLYNYNKDNNANVVPTVKVIESTEPVVISNTEDEKIPVITQEPVEEVKEPVVEEVAPVVEEVKEEVAPIVEEATPAAEEVAPVVEEVKEEVAPVVEETKVNNNNNKSNKKKR